MTEGCHFKAHAVQLFPAHTQQFTLKNSCYNMQKLVSYCLNDTDKIKLIQTRDSIWELLQVTVPELVHRFTAFSDGQNNKSTIIRYLNGKKKEKLKCTFLLLC